MQDKLDEGNEAGRRSDVQNPDTCTGFEAMFVLRRGRRVVDRSRLLRKGSSCIRQEGIASRCLYYLASPRDTLTFNSEAHKSYQRKSAKTESLGCARHRRWKSPSPFKPSTSSLRWSRESTRVSGGHAVASSTGHLQLRALDRAVSKEVLEARRGRPVRVGIRACACLRH